MNQNEKEVLIEKILITEYNRFFRLAYRYTNTEEDAMDIVQEGAYKAMLNSASLKKPEYALTWIYRIMLNETFRFCKKRRKMMTEELTEEALGGLEDKHDNVDLKRALRNLDEKDQAVIILRYFEDRKLSEIADILHENENTIKSRLYRSMVKLKLELDV